MKRLLTLLSGFAAALILVAAPVSTLAATRYWKVEIYKPTATTNKTLNVEFKVFSTVESDDTYTVELFENNVSKATKNISHSYGDSGVFSVSIPAAGTYTYKVVADNVNSGEAPKTSNQQSVQVSDAPEPTVTTVFINQPAAAAPAAQPAAAGAAIAAAPNAPAAAATTPEAATTTGDSTTNPATGSVLGAEAPTKQQPNNRVRNGIIAGVAGLTLVGIGYWLFRRQHALENQ